MAEVALGAFKRSQTLFTVLLVNPLQSESDDATSLPVRLSMAAACDISCDLILSACLLSVELPCNWKCISLIRHNERQAIPAEKKPD